MNATLDGEKVVNLYRHFREADRSLHFLVNPAKTWDEFLAYYHPQKRRQLEEFFDQLQPSAAPLVVEPPRLHAVGFWRFLIAKGLVRRRTDWDFSVEELAWIVQQGRAFLQLLGTRVKPDLEQIVTQRQRLRDAQIFIESRCYGMHELKKVEATAHFDQPAPQPSRTQVA